MPSSSHHSVGCCGFGGDRQRYCRTLSLVEVQDTFVFPPRQATLQRWRQSAPNGFRFVLRAWQLITHEAETRSYRRMPKKFQYRGGECGLFRPTRTVADAYRRTLQCAQWLEADAVLFETPPSFTPTQQNRANLAAFFEGIDRDQRLMVWKPRGVWADDEVAAVCRDLKLVRCSSLVDNEHPGADAYLRLDQSQYSDDDIVRLADRVLQCDRAYCLFSSVNMVRDAQRLVVALGGE